ncbi:hypothetical protein ACN261_05590 [Micromonospora sp. WMMD723]|uniref:hypothetical protein n=1 Tax=unclassified Micromonospora TaxID=2617518 RepID=UPI003B92F15E
MSRERFVVHLPVTADDLVSAQGLARTITRALGFLPDVDRGGTTLSHEDAQPVRHWVYCDRPLTPGRRCTRLADHPDDCAPETHRPSHPAPTHPRPGDQEVCVTLGADHDVNLLINCVGGRGVRPGW